MKCVTSKRPWPRADERGGIADLFHPSVRSALIVGLGLAVFQQITGINTVIYYAPVILQSAGISSASGAILATLGIGIVNVIMTVVAMRLLDRMGRRPLLLIGIAGMTITLDCARLCVPASCPERSVRHPGGDQHDVVRGLVCHQPGTDFLADDLRNLSAENPQFDRGSVRGVQLGLEPGRVSHLFDAGSGAWCELDVLDVRRVLGGRLDFLVSTVCRRPRAGPSKRLRASSARLLQVEPWADACWGLEARGWGLGIPRSIRSPEPPAPKEQCCRALLHSRCAEFLQ